MKQYGKTLILLVCVVIAALVAWRLSKAPTSEELKEQRKRLLPGLETDRVASLAIEEGDRQLVCRRVSDSDQWRISTPIQGRADRWEVEDILDKLQDAEKIWFMPPAEARRVELSKHGLDPPRRVITVTESGPSGRTWKLLVGNAGAAAGGVYVKLEGQEGIAAVDEDVVESTEVTLADVRSKKLAPRIGTYDLRKVAASAAAVNETGAYELKCEKSEKVWEIKQPFFDLADSSKVERLASDLYNHRIKSDDFVSDDPAKVADYGLDDPVLTLTLQGDDESQQFAFAAVEEEEGDTRYYAMYEAETAIVSIPEDLFNKLHKGPDELREKSLIADLITGDVKKVTVEGPDAELVIEDTDEGWTIQGEGPAGADEDVIDDFLQALKDTEVAEFVANEAKDLPRYGLDEKARGRVTLHNEAGDVLAEVVFGETAPEERVYGQRADYPAILAADRGEFYGMLQRGRLAFLDRGILSEPRWGARRVVLENAHGKFECTREDEDADWSLVRPAKGPADQSAIGDVLSVFANLEAEAFAAERADELSAYGLDTPPVSAEVTYRTESSDEGAEEEEEEGEEHTEEPEERVKRLLVGSETSSPAEGYYAMVEGDGRVFVLSRNDAEDLRRQLGSRLVCDAEDITALTFQKGEMTVRFSYDEEEDTWTDADGAEVPEQTASALQDARRMLRDFRATEVAAYMVDDPKAYGFDQPFMTVKIDTETVAGKKIVVGKQTEDGYYVKGPASGFVLVASAEQVEKLTAPLEPPEPPEEAEPESEGEADTGETAE